ncbi:MAG: (Fe-S)-binding protein, partial [Dehalococcoidales bacterium]
MSPLGMTYWGIPGYVIFWSLTALAAGLFSYRIYRLIGYMSLGRRERGFGHKGRRALATAVTMLGHWDKLKSLTIKDRAGIVHAVLPWGFFIFATFYLVFIIIGAGFGISETLENTSFFFYYAWAMDIMSPIVIIAALWGISRRYIARPPRLKGEQTVEAMVVLVTVIIIPVTHLFKMATGIALGYPPAGLGSYLPPVSSAISGLLSGGSTSSLQAANTGFFWAHWLIVLFVLVFIAYSRYLHMVAALFNIFFRSPLAKGTLRSIDLETADTFGAASITDLTRKQVLDLYACVICGQCQDACPATASGKPLNPKKVIQDLKKHLLRVGPELLRARGRAEAASNNPGSTLAGEVITQDEIWACTTCL